MPRLGAVLFLVLLLCLLVLVLPGASGRSGSALSKKRRKNKSPPSSLPPRERDRERQRDTERERERAPEQYGENIQVMITDADGNEKNLDDDLRLACNAGDIDRVSELLEVRREIEAAEGLSRHPRDEYGNSPLHDAARRGLTEVAELLLESGYDVNLSNQMGDQPLHMSAASGHIGVTEALIEHGAQISGLTSWGMSPLWWCAPLALSPLPLISHTNMKSPCVEQGGQRWPCAAGTLSSAARGGC